MDFFSSTAWLPKRPIFGRNRNSKGSPCLLFIYSLMETGYWNWNSPFHFFPMQICELQIYALMPNWHVWCMHLTFFSRQSNHITLFWLTTESKEIIKCFFHKYWSLYFRKYIELNKGKGVLADFMNQPMNKFYYCQANTFSWVLIQGWLLQCTYSDPD